MSESNLDSETRRLAGLAWSFRWRVEREAELRFERLGKRLTATGFSPELAVLAHRASTDESRHAAHCASLAARFGNPVDTQSAVELVNIEPSGLELRRAVIYEAVAACCITETESMGVLTTLLSAEPDPQIAPILHELARDEVQHSRLGWAILAVAAQRGEAAFLGPLIPNMLDVNRFLFEAASEAEERSELLVTGVLPRKAKREVFVEMLRSVIFPGLQTHGIEVGPAEQWLASQERRLLEAS